MEQPSGSKGGFDVASMSLATKLTLGGGILLLIDSFLSWQKVCTDLGVLGGLAGVDSFCAKANAWGGNGSFFGLLMGLLVIVLIAFEVASAAGMQMSMPIPASKLAAYLGFGVLVFAILKFLLAAFNKGTIFAYIGLVLALVIGYGSWLHFQEPETTMTGGSASPPPPPPAV